MPTVPEIPRTDPCLQCPPQECSFDLRRRLSLTRELQRGGCAHYYMNDAFPRLASYVKSLQLPKGLYLVTKAPKGWESFMGTAFDRRLRYEYEPHYSDDVVKVGAHSLAYPLEEVERGVYESRMSPTKYVAVQEGLSNDDLDKRSIYAAVADIEFRSGRGKEAWDALESGGGELLERLMGDLQALLETAQRKLNLSNPVFGPTFSASRWIGGADADIIDERCLIDVKCVTRPSSATKFVRQVIAYALLDAKDEYGLDSVGIYLARQGILWKIPLDDIAEHSGMTISELRAQAPWGNLENIEDLKARINQSTR